uniref:Uncharacterized mitochondrial protein AtMg00810-like n=1 Tax=Tanacetum cinerariifolium TaxID=118510 RepID=A0A6L2NZV0_TANCI|nr:uncharacterized mitochondrial protein AtMg00810-like [Tanacetum cinerariifolium]
MVGTVEQPYKPTTVEEKLDRKNEMKARGTLLIALLNKDQLKFYSYQDAKLLMEAIEKSYGGNKESKKVQRTLLKQKYENFTASSLETLDKTFDRWQKLISQLKIQGEVIEQEDINLKLLKSLPSEWKTHALIWRNKAKIKTIRNKCHITNYEYYDGGFVSFGDSKGRIYGKGKIKTGTLGFNDVYFCKDETSGILKTFITGIENQLDYKVKVIRSDNGIEFKNSVMNQFCDMKGIKREFSVDRTPQQNGVAERKNITHIKATRTMALVIKPYNNTPYELIRGRPPLIDFIKPFGWYSVVSKAMRVFNKKTRIVEETLNIRFLKNAPNVKVNGPDWLLDIDSLTISMNYVPVVAGFQTNGIARTKDNICSPKDSAVDARKKATEVDESQVSDNGGQDNQVTRSEFEGLFQQESHTEHINSTNSCNTVSLPVNTAGLSFVNAASPSPINAAGTPVSTNAFEEHPFERFSPFKNAFSLPQVPIVTPTNDTRIFGNAYDDEVAEEEVGMNNVVSSYIIPDAPLAKFLKDHPKDQVIGNLETPVQTRQMTKINEEHVQQKSDEIFISQDIYVADILKKFGFSTVKTASTPMKPNKALVKDAEAKDVDVHLYRSMIGSLMYLTAFRPDITFSVCACARFQVTPKTSHLHAVKRIFRYLKGQPKLGLWYPRDLPFDLKTYSNSDYARASLNRKSITGGCHFLGKRMMITKDGRCFMDIFAVKTGISSLNTTGQRAHGGCMGSVTVRVRVQGNKGNKRPMLLSPLHAGFGDLKLRFKIMSPKIVDHTFGDPQATLRDTRIFDSGCSRHMTGNKSFLSDYQEYNGGFVAFACSSKGGKITGKGKIKTGKLDFEDVYFVKELKFNLFSIS